MLSPVVSGEAGCCGLSFCFVVSSSAERRERNAGDFCRGQREHWAFAVLKMEFVKRAELQVARLQMARGRALGRGPLFT
jgi:hypothetical protein